MQWYQRLPYGSLFDLISFHSDADKLTALSYAGNGCAGGGGDFLVVGGDSGLVGVDGGGDVGITPGAVDEVGGEFGFVSDVGVDGGFEAEEGDLERTGVVFQLRKGACLVLVVGVATKGVFEEVGDLVKVGIGHGVLLLNWSGR